MSRCPLCNSKGECLEYCGWEIKDVWEDVVNKLESENTKLKEQLAVAVEVLEFYKDLDRFCTSGRLTASHALKQIKEIDR